MKCRIKNIGLFGVHFSRENNFLKFRVTAAPWLSTSFSWSILNSVRITLVLSFYNMQPSTKDMPWSCCNFLPLSFHNFLTELWPILLEWKRCLSSIISQPFCPPVWHLAQPWEKGRTMTIPAFKHMISLFLYRKAHHYHILGHNRNVISCLILLVSMLPWYTIPC